MSQIAYNPAELEINRVYFERVHKLHLEAYKQKRFKNNSNKMEIIMQDILYSYITNISNAYKYGINYDGLRDSDGDYEEWLSDCISEKVTFEKYFRLDKQALLYTYISNGTIKCKAFNAGRFYIEYDENGVPFLWVIKTGFSRITTTQEDYDLLHHFKKFEIKDGVGTITKKVIKTLKNDSYEGWDLLPDWKSDEWIADEIIIDGAKIKPSFNVNTPPFVLLGDNLLRGEVSNLIALENETVTGDAYAVLGLLMSILYKALVTGGINPDDWETFVDNFGLQFNVAKLPAGANATMLQMPENVNADNYKKYFQGITRMLLQGDGGDPSSMFEDVKVESGTARQLQMQNIETVRNDYIEIYKRKEREWWNIVKSLKPTIKIPTKIYFNPLPLGLTKTEIEDLENKQIDKIQKAFDSGVITRQEKIDKIRDILKMAPIKADRIDKAAEKTMMVARKAFTDESNLEDENQNNEEIENDSNQ